MIWHTFFQPFIEFGFMRRALVVSGAVAEHHHAGRLPAAAAHEPDGRCAVARHSPRRGGGVSAERHVAAGHDPRRLHRRYRGCPGGRVGEPADTVKRGRQFCRILSGLAGRRHRCRCAAPAWTSCICYLAPFWRSIAMRRCLSAASPA